MYNFFYSFVFIAQEIPQSIQSLEKRTRTRVLLTSSICPLHLLISEKRHEMKRSVKEIQTHILALREDVPSLRNPSLPQEIVHGIDFDEETFCLEWEVESGCLYSKILKI